MSGDENASPKPAAAVPDGSTAPPERRVWCNRTLNLRAIKAVGYDMDYTLVHYRTDEWERVAFKHSLVPLAARGWPVDDLAFDPASVIQGLAFDLELGNLVKATRFGYVIRAHHGTRPLGFEEQRTAYASTFVDLSEPRWQFMNTLFSLSEANLFAQLVDRLDAGKLPGIMGYRELHQIIRSALDEAHNLGELKSAITADPDRFVDLDPEVPLTLLDQKKSGKLLLLVTNSDWGYTHSMMGYAFDRFLPRGTPWRGLFDLVIVEARKPSFFSGRQAVYRLVDEEQGLLHPHHGALEAGRVYAGGDALRVESSLGLSGAQILYVGDHLFGDVHVSKAMLRWRTGLVLREIEPEVRALEASRAADARLAELMSRKVQLDAHLARLRLERQRREMGYGPRTGPMAGRRVGEIEAESKALNDEGQALDALIAPLAKASGEIGNETWGPLMRAGNDKSLFARQVERYADIYTSRVSNLLAETPFAYLRAARGSLPHDPA
jgi:HAD superfamily 5'-nucleotidase-like hydrolase